MSSIPRKIGRYDAKLGKMVWCKVGDVPPESVRMQGIAYAKPLVSNALGCHSTQVKDFNQELQAKNVSGARYLPDGRVEFESRAGRREFCKALGYYDADAGYGDWSGK